MFFSLSCYQDSYGDVLYGTWSFLVFEEGHQSDDEQDDEEGEASPADHAFPAF